MLLPVATQAEAGWVQEPTVQQQLAAGQVAVRMLFDGNQSRMQVLAAVKVNATPETIWRVLTDCEHAANFIPGVKRCRRVQSAPDDSWEIVEQEAKYSWFMPAPRWAGLILYSPDAKWMRAQYPLRAQSSCSLCLTESPY